MKSKIFWAIIILVLIGGNVYLWFRYQAVEKELESTKIVVATQRYNELTLNFLKMFITQVIKSDREVDFETRLKLENSVRALNDPQILASWTKFVNSTGESEAQTNVKDLLELLVNKVYIR